MIPIEIVHIKKLIFKMNVNEIIDTFEISHLKYVINQYNIASANQDK